MIYPESAEDLGMIAETYMLTDEDLEDIMYSLTSYLDLMQGASESLRCSSTEMERYRNEAEEYGEECSQLLQEVQVRIKYDPTLAVAADFLAWEVSFAAAVAEELRERLEKVDRQSCDLDSHTRMVAWLRDLLDEYLNPGKLQSWCDDARTEESHHGEDSEED